MKSLLIFCSVCFCVFCSFAETAEHRPSGESYHDPETKVQFPAQIQNFRKQEVVRSFNPMIGTTIRYADPDGNCADIYVYLHPKAEKEITESQLKLHFEEIQKTVLSLPGKGVAVKKAELIRESGLRMFQKGPAQSVVNGHQAVFWITTADNVAHLSHLIIFPYNGRIVKLRISSDEAKAAEFTTGVVNLFFGNP